jgi:hypothetical protein
MTIYGTATTTNTYTYSGLFFIVSIALLSDSFTSFYV